MKDFALIICIAIVSSLGRYHCHGLEIRNPTKANPVMYFKNVIIEYSTININWLAIYNILSIRPNFVYKPVNMRSSIWKKDIISGHS